jgi:RNA polymerase sigma-70 factor (ECF subfamily)
MHMPDAELVGRIARGEDGAFEELLERFQPRVYRLACRLVSPGEADDVTQEVFIQVFKSLPRFRGASSLSTWIYRVTFNTCQNYRLREEKHQHLPEPSWEVADRSAQRQLDGCVVADALNRLDEKHRSVVILHELHGLTYKEIAEALKTPVGTIKSRLFNALKRLREILTDAKVEAT